jgi:GAF domain-containing protein
MKESFQGLFRRYSESLKPDVKSRIDSDDWVTLISFLHWFVPLSGSLIATGYIIFEQCILQEQSILAPEILRTLLVVGFIVPSIAWLALTWVQRATLAVAKAQTNLAFRNRELAALNAIGQATAQSLELEEITQTALAKMIELFDLDAVELRLLERDSLVLKVHHGVSADFVLKESIIGAGKCICGKCVTTGKAQVIGHLQAESALSNTPCVKEGFESSLSIPMKSKGRVVGVIHVASRASNAFSETDQETLIAIGDRVATAVENSILYKQAKQRAIQLETTSLIGQRLATLLDPNPLFSEVVRLIREKFDYYHTGILLSDYDSGELVLKEASGAGADLIKSKGLRLKIGQQGISGWVAHTGQAFLCNDVSKESRYYRTEGTKDTRAELAVPLRVGTRVIGVLDVQSNHPDVFDKEDIIILQILANQLGIAIENARLFQETRQRYRAMVALHETSLDMISQLNMSDLLQAFLRRGVQLIGAHGAILFLYDADRKLISSPAQYNTYHDLTEATWSPSEGLIGKVIETGKPLIINDYEDWEGKEKIFSDGPLRHTRVIGLPLVWQNQVIGGVNVLNRSTDRPFDQNDLWLMSLFGDLVTIAIKNADLHTQVKEFNQDLEHKVIERTKELMKAKEEVASKAQQLSSLFAQTIRIQEEERARIARDLHDGIIQLTSAVKYEIQAAQVASGDILSPSTHQKLNAALEVLDEMEKEIRRTIYDLHPAMLDSLGLVPALRKYINRFQEISRISCDIQVMGEPTYLAPSTDIAIYRLVEEALNNVATHASAELATVVIDYEPNILCITIQDDGHGFDYRQWQKNHNGKHLGLLGMQERVENLAGEMRIWSEPGQGTRLTILLPFKKGSD